jgi:tetratricopeptide (TPR) repeat protein
VVSLHQYLGPARAARGVNLMPVSDRHARKKIVYNGNMPNSDGEGEIVDGLLKDAEAALSTGSTTRATGLYHAILAMSPDHPAALRQLGGLEVNRGNPENALVLFERAKAKGFDADLCHAIATALRMMGRPGLAQAALAAALEVDPHHAPSLYDKALEHQRKGELGAAQGTYAKLGSLGALHAKSFLNYGVVLYRQGNLVAAERWFQAAAHMEPESALPFINLAMIYRVWGFLPQAVACLEHAVSLAPDNADAHWNLANALLASGDFARGFAEYEWRFRRAGRGERATSLPRWKGEPLAGKTILLTLEQGIGDAIQFIRFAADLKARGATVVAECHPGLERLIATAPGVAHALSVGSPAMADYYLPLMSLPHVMGLTPEILPAQTPYVRVPAGAPAFALAGKFKAGLVWRGNPQHENDLSRSVPLTLLTPLLDVPGVVFFSLQVGKAASELEAAPWDQRVLDLGRRLTDFAATASAVAALDLVITVDTAVAHLAGALGKPTWLLIAQGNDWRWLHERGDTPWYPSLRLFRQGKHRNWQPAIKALTAALQERAANPP